jgi:hypothetical protein
MLLERRLAEEALRADADRGLAVTERRRASRAQSSLSTSEP